MIFLLDINKSNQGVLLEASGFKVWREVRRVG